MVLHLPRSPHGLCIVTFERSESLEQSTSSSDKALRAAHPYAALGLSLAEAVAAGAGKNAVEVRVTF